MPGLRPVAPLVMKGFLIRLLVYFDARDGNMELIVNVKWHPPASAAEVDNPARLIQFIHLKQPI